MNIWVLDNIPVATERSRRDLSIGEVRFDVWIDYLRQKPLQSIGFIKFLEGSGAYPENKRENRDSTRIFFGSRSWTDGWMSSSLHLSIQYPTSTHDHQTTQPNPERIFKTFELSFWRIFYIFD